MTTDYWDKLLDSDSLRCALSTWINRLVRWFTTMVKIIVSDELLESKIIKTNYSTILLNHKLLDSDYWDVLLESDWWDEQLELRLLRWTTWSDYRDELLGSEYWSQKLLNSDYWDELLESDWWDEQLDIDYWDKLLDSDFWGELVSSDCWDELLD